MFVLGDETVGLAEGALVVALALLFLPFLKPSSQPARALVFLLLVVLSWRYMVWRFSETLPKFEFSLEALVGWGFAALEGSSVLSSTLAFFILSRTRDRKLEADEHVGWWRGADPPRVDILIATYNEEEAILERTVAGAMASLHPAVRVWVLDDGRRAWLAQLCSRLGAHYLTRTDNSHAKAGNINAALATLRRLPDSPQFVSILDADFVPHRNYVARMLSLFHDPEVGLVQSPQHFFNADPIQHNLGIGRAYPDEQRFFFDHLQPARDAWGISFCCGTSSMIRWEALEAIGGFPTDSVTEDFLVTLCLREEGWSTVYLNEPLTEGLAPEGLREYVTQRGRWCLGLMQIIRGPMGPFCRNRLRWIDRLGLVDSLLFWATTYPFRIACLLTPPLYWLLGVNTVNATVAGVLAHFVPYYLGVIIGLNWTSRGLVVPILNDVSRVLGALEITRAVLIGLFGPKGHKFKVTAKGGDRSRIVVQWPLLKPLLAVFLLTLAGLLVPIITDIVFEHDAGDGKIVILFWTAYNLAVLFVSMLVCIEMPRRSVARQIAPESIKIDVGGWSAAGWMMRLTPEDAWVRGGPSIRVGVRVRIQVSGIGWLDCEVQRVEPSGFALSIWPDSGQRPLILAKLHTAEGAQGTTETHPLRLLGDALWQAFRA